MVVYILIIILKVIWWDKMKKIYLILIVSLLLIGIITAGIIETIMTTQTKTITLTSEEKTALQQLDLTSYDVEDYAYSFNNTDYIKRCLNISGVGCFSIYVGNKTQSRIQEQLDNIEMIVLKNIAQNQINKNKQDSIILRNIGNGITTIK